VNADAPLFALEAESEAAARREAEERLKRSLAQVDDLRRGLRATEIDAVRAQLAQAEVAAELSTKEHVRQLDLVSKGFVSQQRADEAKAARDRDRGKVTELRAQLATARSGSRPDEIRGCRGRVARRARVPRAGRLAPAAEDPSRGGGGRRGDRYALSPAAESCPRALRW
jgi:HlyD family secretion protein